MIFSKVHELERKLQKATPKTYPVLAFLPLLQFSQLLRLATSDAVLNNPDVLARPWNFLLSASICIVAVLLLYPARLWVIYFYRMYRAPFTVSVSTRKRTMAYICISLMLFQVYTLVLISQDESSSTPQHEYLAVWISGVSIYGHFLILYILVVLYGVLGSIILREKSKKEDEMLEMTETTAPEGGSAPIMPATKDTSNAAQVEPSAIEAGLYMLVRPKLQKSDATDTKGDFIVRFTLLLLCEALYFLLLFAGTRAFRQLLKTKDSKNRSHLHRALMLLLCGMLLTGAMSIFMLVRFLKDYKKWKSQRKAMALSS